MKKINKKVIWSVVALLIAIFTIRAVFVGSGMTLQQVRDGLRRANPAWMLPALFCMFGILYFEGEAVLIILKSVGVRRPHRSGFLYSAADAYFSAITPSATGGQPASAFFMMLDGVSGPVSAAVLLMNTMMYTVSLVVCGLIGIALRPGVFFRLGKGSKILIALGLLVIIGQVIVFWFALQKPSLLSRIANALIRLLHKIHLIRRPEKWQDKIRKMLEEYGSCVEILSGRRMALAKAFLMNMLQRASQFTCVVFVYLGLGGSSGNILELWVLQCLIYIGVYCVPIPGSMGVTDALMLDGYLKLMNRDMAFQTQILTRGLTFYCCIAISAVAVLIGYLCIRKKRKDSY